MVLPDLASSIATNAGSLLNTEATAATEPQQLSSSFADMVHAGVQQAGSLETNAQTAVMGLLNGQGVEVHGAMIATQKAELAFELALQVRNKAVAAYQQMMQMQF